MFYCMLHVTLLSPPEQHCRAALYKFHIVIVIVIALSDKSHSALWDLSDNAVDNVCVAWRKGLRRTLDLPACTHSRFIAPVCGLLPLRDELVRRCASFIFTCLSSDNTSSRPYRGMASIS